MGRKKMIKVIREGKQDKVKADEKKDAKREKKDDKGKGKEENFNAKNERHVEGKKK